VRRQILISIMSRLMRHQIKWHSYLENILWDCHFMRWQSGDFLKFDRWVVPNQTQRRLFSKLVEHRQRFKVHTKYIRNWICRRGCMCMCVRY
jgi:hypothetical protein